MAEHGSNGSNGATGAINANGHVDGSPSGERLPPPQPEALRLLHVEDNPADAALIQAHIEYVLPDVTFDTVTRLAELSSDRAARADCAILDLSLPDASGLEALLALRGMSAELPIIVLTGFDDLPLGLTALRNGAEDYLVKNHVDGYTLQRAIRYAIERRGLTLALLQLAAIAVTRDG